ncbi:MAG: hypothetical protein WDA06_00850 [Phenylobacterium sp.]
MKDFYVAVDFDGTVVDHCYPDIGSEVPGAEEWLKKLDSAGVKLILFTMRSNGIEGNYLNEAVSWFKARGIKLFGINRNPTQDSWTDSPKAYAHIYVDDAAFGCPLKENPKMGGRPYVDWSVVGPAIWAELGDDE